MPGRKHKYCIYLTEEQLSALKRLSVSYMAPYAEVMRARIILLSYEHPEWSIRRIADQVGCRRSTVTKFRHRWIFEGSLENRPRPGAPRKYQPTVRAQIIALACTKPKDHGKPWQRWSAEKLARVAREQGISPSVSASTIRRWLREDNIKPWRYHFWQKPTDSNFVEKAAPILDLYEKAPELHKKGEIAVCVDEKTSIQARRPLHETTPAVPGHPAHVAARYKRMGALQLFCGLLVASGITYARTFARKRFLEFKIFLSGLFASVAAKGLKVIDLILDNGSTHAPKQLAGWIASLHLPFDVRIFWLPKYASWLDQVEIIFSKVTRDVLTPNDFKDKKELSETLMQYLDELNRYPKPIKWIFTKAKLIAKFAAPSVQMAAQLR
jgi:transposase